MAAELGLHCLPMSHKKDARLIWANLGLFGTSNMQFALWGNLVPHKNSKSNLCYHMTSRLGVK